MTPRSSGEVPGSAPPIKLTTNDPRPQTAANSRVRPQDSADQRRFKRPSDLAKSSSAMHGALPKENASAMTDPGIVWTLATVQRIPGRVGPAVFPRSLPARDSLEAVT